MNYAPTGDTQEIFCKGYRHLQRYNNICVATSGGSDSDELVDIIEILRQVDDIAKTNPKITYVFYNTGLEYKATKRHLDYLRDKYNIEIVEEKAAKPIPTCCKEYGVPFLSKYVSEMIMRLQSHNFKFEDKPYEELIKEYPKCQVALKWWCNANPPSKNGTVSSFNIGRDKWLKEFMVANPPTFKISNKCCHYAKKLPAERFLKKGNFDLNITGIRRDEGGIRARQYSTCFYDKSGKDYAVWMPLFWMTDKIKRKKSTIQNARLYIVIVI